MSTKDDLMPQSVYFHRPNSDVIANDILSQQWVSNCENVITGHRDRIHLKHLKNFLIVRRMSTTAFSSKGKACGKKSSAVAIMQWSTESRYKKREKIKLSDYLRITRWTTILQVFLLRESQISACFIYLSRLMHFPPFESIDSALQFARDLFYKKRQRRKHNHFIF